MKKLTNIIIIILIILIVVVMQLSMLKDESSTSSFSEYDNVDKPIVKVEKPVLKIDKPINDVKVSSVPIIKKEDPVAKELREKRENEALARETILIDKFKSTMNTDNFFVVLRNFYKLEEEIVYETDRLENLRNLLRIMKKKKFPELREEYADLLDNKYADIDIYTENRDIIFESEDFVDKDLRFKFYSEQKENLEMMNFEYIKFDFGENVIKRHKLKQIRGDDEV